MIEHKMFALSELQDILYDILKAFADFCDEHNLRYYLFGGTLLGAVRHNNFIPWDDVVDVSMPRPDYERFIELTKNSPWEYYEICQYTQPFIKMVDTRTVMKERLLKDDLNTQSVFIDIFPIDGLPSSALEQKRHFNKLRRYKRYLVYSIIDARKISKNNFFKSLVIKIATSFFSMFDYKRFRDSLNKEAQRYSYFESEFVSVGIWGWAEKDISRKSELENRVAIPFRDSIFWCQGDYDRNLKQKYGNYLEMPPKDQRPPFHGICYWKEEYDKK